MGHFAFPLPYLSHILSAASDPYRASPLKTRSFSPGLANLDFEMKVFVYGYRAKNSA
jgi:hypothetical protein